jgi:type I restriction-modification system DNA methylase subunit
VSVAGEHLAGYNPEARLVMYGQELNAESYAICKAEVPANARQGTAHSPGTINPSAQPSQRLWL